MLRILFAALLVLSLAGKVIWSAPAPEPDARAAAAALIGTFQSAGFEARIVELQRSPGIVVEAARGSCRVVAGDYPVHGTFQDVYRQLAAGIGPLRFVHRGGLQESEPKLSGLVRFYLWRELSRVGIEARRAPIIALAASVSCNLGDVPWEMTRSVVG